MMSQDKRAPDWRSIGQTALNFLLVGTLILAVMNDWRQSVSEKRASDQAARLMEMSALLGKADLRAAALEKAVADAKTDIETSRAAAEKTQSATQSVLEGNTAALAAANQKLTAATDAIAKLRTDVVWRELPEPKRSNLIAALSRSAPSAINLMYMAHDSESLYYARRIGSAFQAAGWRLNYVSASFSGGFVTGLVLSKADNPATYAVAAAFQSNGFEVPTFEVPEPTETIGGDRAGIPVTLVIGAHALH